MTTKIDHPIIVGVADIKNATRDLPEDGSDEPLSLILKAIEAAVKDTGLSEGAAKELQGAIDSISVVRPWSWPYPDLATLLSEKLNVSDTVTYKFNSPHGGNQPAKLLDEACQRIAHGKTRVALLTGGEAMDSLTNHIQNGQLPPPGWTPVEFDASMAEGLKPPEGDDTVEGIHGLGAPIQVYALYENAFRAAKGQSFAANNEESAQMYAEFAQVSKQNPYSWHCGQADSKETIGQPSKRNRMINTPYPMLMCAFNKVNISGACLVTSSSFAEKLGIAKDRWIYVRGGAGTAESEEFYLRSAYTHSPAITQSIDAALRVAELDAKQIDLYDFYSCFPIVPKLACKHLGLPTSNPPKPITLLGGLTSFGGAGNNYSMHAITEMTRRLRKGGDTREKNGLVLANGGVLSYQHVVVLSNEPRKQAYPSKHALPEHCEQLAADRFDQVAKQGDATIEAYTVDFTRKGAPRRGQIVARCVDNKQRFIANHADEHTLRILADTQQSQEVVGRRGRVWQDEANPKRNIFSLSAEQKL